MSSAFVRESDYMPLSEVMPNLSSLLIYLRRENGGAAVRQLNSYYSEKHRREINEMSDGLSYALNDENRWVIILD